MKTNLITSLQILLLILGTALGCAAQPKGMIYEPVCYEDGTSISGERDVEAILKKDRLQCDTTVSNSGDTLITVRHTSAFLRMQLEGLPADAGIDHILLVPMKGEPKEIPVTVPESGKVVVWMTRAPGKLPATAAIATAKDGRMWSARLK